MKLNNDVVLDIITKKNNYKHNHKETEFSIYSQTNIHK